MSAYRGGGSAFCLSVPDFDISQTLSCGQCFRFGRNDDGSWSGTAPFGRLRLWQKGSDVFFRGGGSEKEIVNYFDLDTDYREIRRILCGDELLARMVAFGSGIRIMRQPPFEMLCSFIISQNNHIPRIEAIIRNLCGRYGAEGPGGEKLFPPPERLAALSPADLAPLRLGYRDGYLLDAARKTVSGELDFSLIARSDIEIGRRELRKVLGVGPKVADCVLLFGFHKLNAFPEDVWIKRAMARWFPAGLPDFAKPYAGVAQQYIYHYARSCESKDTETA